MYCPCGTGKHYLKCCGTFIEIGKNAPSAETLMRSRYTAYTLADITYINKTMRGKSVEDLDQSIHWLGLNVIKTTKKTEFHVFVEFIAKYQKSYHIYSLHEISEFLFENGCWYYIDGLILPSQTNRISLNGPCYCGNGKKFKNCHGK